MTIYQNLENIREKIAVAASESGRVAADVTLVAVTKTVSVDLINEAILNGIADIGENRVQEFLSKESELQPCRRHLIGHLQRNKVRQIVGKVELIHSVDSVTLLREIDAQAAKLGITQDILMQINVSNEESKFGMNPDACREFVEIAGTLENVGLSGVMTIPPMTDDVGYLREIFLRTKALFDELKAQSSVAKNATAPFKRSLENLANFDVLSMGMSGDFEVAIECGSTMVRIGSSIFGKRDYY